ncbi:MAG: flagellar biosynthetic protein FliO [Chloroherpetonaceae bacterium]|nr:flagellar biosynthetic protein FliO [Chthonomonadaceae bacterium]MDW8207174.1 flagellar biosynthetic protein FliO [Chloroherpetonaceae bacterium]
MKRALLLLLCGVLVLPGAREVCAQRSTAGVPPPVEDTLQVHPPGIPVPATDPQNKPATRARPAESARLDTPLPQAPPVSPSARKSETRATERSLAPSDPVLAQTRPDMPAPPEKPAVRTQDNPFAPIADGGRMLVYLIPLLLLIVGGLHLLRLLAFRKQGNAPQSGRGSLLERLLGGLYLHRAQQHAGASIRLIESVPLGNGHLHLLEVRDRLLLLGATGGSMSLLAEWEHPAVARDDGFHHLLQAATADLSGLDLAPSELPARALIGTLEDEMRETGTALERRARRLRTVLELQSGDEQPDEDTQAHDR